SSRCAVRTSACAGPRPSRCSSGVERRTVARPVRDRVLASRVLRMTSATTPGTQRALPLVAIAGNPNTGKTTLFNRLTGADHKVGNYPGVTIERHFGRIALPGGRAAQLVDVPGAYSLSARSREEEIAIQAVAGLAPHKA